MMLSCSLLDKMRRGARLYVRRPGGALVAWVVDVDGARWLDLAVTEVLAALQAHGVSETQPEGDVRVFVAAPATAKPVWRSSDEASDDEYSARREAGLSGGRPRTNTLVSPTDGTMEKTEDSIVDHRPDATGDGMLSGRTAHLPRAGKLLMRGFAQALAYSGGAVSSAIRTALREAGATEEMVCETNPRKGIYVVCDEALETAIRSLGGDVAWYDPETIEATPLKLRETPAEVDAPAADETPETEVASFDNSAIPDSAPSAAARLDAAGVDLETVARIEDALGVEILDVTTSDEVPEAAVLHLAVDLKTETVTRVEDSAAVSRRTVDAVNRLVDVACLLTLVPAAMAHRDDAGDSPRLSAGVELLLMHVDELLDEACAALGHEGAVSGYMAEPDGDA